MGSFVWLFPLEKRSSRQFLYKSIPEGLNHGQWQLQSLEPESVCSQRVTNKNPFAFRKACLWVLIQISLGKEKASFPIVNTLKSDELSSSATKQSQIISRLDVEILHALVKLLSIGFPPRRRISHDSMRPLIYSH
ncbi:hypothetical protein ABG067_005218 [Albugo candida]